MVRIALAGASGNVAQELLEVLVSQEKHEIILLSRKDIAHSHDKSRVKCAIVNYEHSAQMIQALEGVHTLLCFITPQTDPGSLAQKTLIDAAVKAGVKRYAPSEWASSSFEHMPWYANKTEIRDYLARLNQDEKVLEYCLFQAGMFVDYFVSPYRTSKHIHPFQNQFDFNNRRAILLSGAENARISLITAGDFCAVIAKAIDFEGEWPVVGGIRGDEVTVEHLIAVGEKIRGPFTIDTVYAEDLKVGVVKSTWLPRVDHPAIPPEKIDELAAGMVAGMLLAISAGAMRVSDEWNRLLPDYDFTLAEDFLAEAWRGKP